MTVEQIKLENLPPHLRLGMAGEDAAAAILSAAGYFVLERNWRCGKLELDLVCAQDDMIVFVEVKTRSKNSHGGGYGAINNKKCRNLLAAAQIWLERNALWQNPCRFDILCLYGSGESFRMEHYPNAITQTLDSRHAYW